MATMYLTDRLVKTIESPVGRAEVWDTVVPGLGLRYSGRQKTWFFVYHSPESLDSRGRRRRRRLTLGSYPKVPLAEARGKAAEFRERIRLGHDPADIHEPVEPEELRFRDLAERFYEAEARSLSQKRRYSWALRSLLPVLGDRSVVSIKRTEIAEYLSRVRERGPSVAKLQLASLQRILQWGMLQFDLPSNPARGIVLEPSPPRERVLTTEEVRNLWQACQRAPTRHMSLFLRLRLVTAQRGAQLRRFNFNQLERSASGLWWNIPSGITKTGKPNRVFLSPLAEEVLATARPSADGWLFGPTSTKRYDPGVDGHQLKDVRESAPGDWRAADLRRTAATWMAQRGVPRFVVKRVLGHADRDITAVYDRYSYDREVKAAVLILEQAIREAIGEMAAVEVEPVDFPSSGASPFFPEFPGLPR